jgi:guanine deaminase
MSEHFIVRGTVAHCLDAPVVDPVRSSVEVFEDGVIEVADGRIISVGSAPSRMADDVRVIDARGHLLVPGLFDVHTHYPQTGMIGAWGEQLLDWLAHYTFPTEARFSDSEYADRIADIFVRHLLANGTTTAMVFGTVHPQSVDAVMKRARAASLQLIAGKVMMDRNAPTQLCDTPASSYAQSKALAERWHGVDRLHYAVTPRFAPTSSSAQLEQAARLLSEHPGTYLQTHVAESTAEVAWVRDLFPQARSYLDVYAGHGLLTSRSVLAHCLHLDDPDLETFAASGAAMAFCPSSNLFLGSGLLDVSRADRHRIPIGIGTDVGAGTSFSVLRTLGDAYKVAQMQGQVLTPARMLYMATLGGAHALGLASRGGNFAPGKDADIVVLDPSATELTALRLEDASDPLETLFALSMLADERHVRATFAHGRQVHGALMG